MNREDCIKIMKDATYNRRSFLEDNRYRFKMANVNGRYNHTIDQHTKELNELDTALKYLEENLK